jgi:hypothetical protein
MAFESSYKSQLIQQRVRSKKLKKKKSSASGVAKQPLSKLVVPLVAAFGFEVLTFGVAPGWTAQVWFTYRQEKKIKGSANIAEYIVVGILTLSIDAVQIIGMIPALAFFTLFLTAPALCLLSTWRLYKRIKLGF